MFRTEELSETCRVLSPPPQKKKIEKLVHLVGFIIKIYMFRRVSLSIIRSSSLYTQQWYTSYKFADSFPAGSGRPPWSCSQALWHTSIPLLCVQWKTPDDGQRNCPKHVEFYSKNEIEKLVHLVGFIIRIYHDAQSPEIWCAACWLRNLLTCVYCTEDAHKQV